MTNQDAIHELKMLYNKYRSKDWYGRTREALTIAINAIYDKEEDDEYNELNRTDHKGSRYKRITERYEDSEV